MMNPQEDMSEAVSEEDEEVVSGSEEEEECDPELLYFHDVLERQKPAVFLQRLREDKKFAGRFDRMPLGARVSLLKTAEYGLRRPVSTWTQECGFKTKYSLRMKSFLHKCGFCSRTFQKLIALQNHETEHRLGGEKEGRKMINPPCPRRFRHRKCKPCPSCNK